MLGAAAVAGVSARSYVGAWNDGSRLATVECIVDHGTWAIDDSIFVKPAAAAPDVDPIRQLVAAGTKDKLRIAGRYYSDKSPVPALLMAGGYALVQSITGCTVAGQTDQFCELLCLATSGLAYVLAVLSIDRLGRIVGLSPRGSLGLTASFALTTVAPVYARHVNNHIMLLGVTAALLVELVELGRVEPAAAEPYGRLLLAGALAGFAYTIDLGAGPGNCRRCRRVGRISASSTRHGHFRGRGCTVGIGTSRDQFRDRWDARAGQRPPGIPQLARQPFQCR